MKKCPLPLSHEKPIGVIPSAQETVENFVNDVFNWVEAGRPDHPIFDKNYWIDIDNYIEKTCDFKQLNIFYEKHKDVCKGILAKMFGKIYDFDEIRCALRKKYKFVVFCFGEGHICEEMYNQTDKLKELKAMAGNLKHFERITEDYAHMQESAFDHKRVFDAVMKEFKGWLETGIQKHYDHTHSDRDEKMYFSKKMCIHRNIIFGAYLIFNKVPEWNWHPSIAPRRMEAFRKWLDAHYDKCIKKAGFQEVRPFRDGEYLEEKDDIYTNPYRKWFLDNWK